MDEKDFDEFCEAVNNGIRLLFAAFRLGRDSGTRADNAESLSLFDTAWEALDAEEQVALVSALVAIINNDHPNKTPVFKFADDDGKDVFGDDRG